MLRLPHRAFALHPPRRHPQRTPRPTAPCARATPTGCRASRPGPLPPRAQSKPPGPVPPVGSRPAALRAGPPTGQAEDRGCASRHGLLCTLRGAAPSRAQSSSRPAPPTRARATPGRRPHGRKASRPARSPHGCRASRPARSPHGCRASRPGRAWPNDPRQLSVSWPFRPAGKGQLTESCPDVDAAERGPSARCGRRRAAGYSERRAITGSRRPARWAGTTPNTIPTAAETPNASAIDHAGDRGRHRRQRADQQRRAHAQPDPGEPAQRW